MNIPKPALKITIHVSYITNAAPKIIPKTKP